MKDIMKKHLSAKLALIGICIWLLALVTSISFFTIICTELLARHIAQPEVADPALPLSPWLVIPFIIILLGVLIPRFRKVVIAISAYVAVFAVAICPAVLSVSAVAENSPAKILQKLGFARFFILLGLLLGVCGALFRILCCQGTYYSAVSV